MKLRVYQRQLIDARFSTFWMGIYLRLSLYNPVDKIAIATRSAKQPELI
ncbi:MAG: hypothetical protein IIC78_00445 [Chloroflexi bacterium]|nr:hypothetical protein [Chloroflexota bacterium]